ncbi:MAG: hypothetical protein ACK5MN_08095 [Lachnospiraceae bacterium]
MKEIGGYLQLERQRGDEYYPSLLRLNLGRTALLFLMKSLNIKRLWMPHLLCASVIDTCEKAGYSLSYYSIDENLAPVLNRTLHKDEYLFLVNYYGTLTDDAIRHYQEVYTHIIVDHTHAFFQAPLPGIPTLYSCRKFFGLPDGAYLYTGRPESDLWASYSKLEMDISCDRMAHILGRFETDASTYYSQMLATAHSYEDEMVKQMSPLTRNLLCGIDYPAVQRTREQNYSFLQHHLSASNQLKFPAPTAPFVYPYYHRQAPLLRQKLAAAKVYIPVYWKNVIELMPSESIEHTYAQNILPLPCDQRYTLEDMQELLSRLTTALDELEGKEQ